jgi:tetratricopeptide (TPR) repeat protein
VCPFSDVHSIRVPAVIGVLILFCASLSAQNTPNRSDRNSGPTLTYSVRGKVLDAEDHAQLGDIRVELRSFTGATIGTMITREAGNFEFLNLSQGHYDLIVQGAGYHTIAQQLDVHQSILGFSVELHRTSTMSTPTPEPSSVSARELSIPRNAHDAMDKGLTLLYRKSNYQGSIKQFERAVRDYPEYYEAYTQIGIAYLHMGNSASAEIVLRKAVELSREQYADASSWLATLLNDKRRFVEAEPLARKALELDSNSWQANAELARSLLGLNNPAEAEKSALAASKLQPDNASLYLVLVNVHSQLENVSALLEDLNNYIRLAPTGPMADKARAERKRIEDELRDAQQTPPPPPTDPHPAEAIKDRTADTLGAAVSNFDDSPTLESGGQEHKPVLWPPTNVDAAVPPVTPGVSCPLEQVLQGARKRVQELLENVDRFTATEVVDFAEIGRDGSASRSLQYTFDYLGMVSLSHNGDLRFDESRKETGRINPTPIPIRTVGLAVGAAVFHPLRFDDFETTCEGLGQWHGKPAWQLRFEQRPDKPPRFQAVFANDHWFDVKLKGRVWISPETSQIQHIDFDLLEAIAPIRLQTEHMSIDYGAVEFPKRKLQLWLPETVSFYIDVGGHRFLNRHQLSNYLLFAVDTNQQVKLPREPN